MTADVLKTGKHISIPPKPAPASIERSPAKPEKREDDLHWTTAITKISPNEILLRGRRIDQLMGEITFSQAIYLALTGSLPKEAIVGRHKGSGAPLGWTLTISDVSLSAGAGFVSGALNPMIGTVKLERVQADMRARVYGLINAGALPQQVDGALQKFGMAMGPFTMYDMAGNDIGWEIRKRRAKERPDMVYSKFADRICEKGWFGQKAGRGWYRYEDGRTPDPAPEVESLIRHNVGAEQALIQRGRRRIAKRWSSASSARAAAPINQGVSMYVQCRYCWAYPGLS